jgi:hypothetical protein
MKLFADTRALLSLSGFAARRMNCVRHASIFSLVSASSLTFQASRAPPRPLMSLAILRSARAYAASVFERIGVFSLTASTNSRIVVATLRGATSCSGLRRRIVSFQPFALSAPANVG